MVKQTLLGATMEPEKEEALCAMCIFPLEGGSLVSIIAIPPTKTRRESPPRTEDFFEVFLVVKGVD